MEQLISAQHELFGRISRTTDNLRKLGSNKITLSLVQSSLSLLDKKWEKLEEQHNKLRADFWDSLKAHDYLVKDFIAQAEDVYLLQRAKVLDLERSLTPAKCSGESSPSESQAVGPDRQHSLTTLPRIHLPEFSGRFEDWPAFRDLFTSLICKEGMLTNVEKLHYLKNSVKSSAGELIRNLPVTGDNFLRAWSLLTTHYKNKCLLVRAYYTAFTFLPKMKVKSASELRKIVNGILTTAASLEGIGRPISNGTDLFVHLTVDLLDPRTRREWEDVIGGTKEPPLPDELRAFLERKLNTLEALSANKNNNPTSKGESASRSARTHHVNGLDNAYKQCPLCSKSHYILYCLKFKAKSAEERNDAIQRHHLCLNCLGRHAVSACKSIKTCTRCSERHHSSLHDALAKGESTVAVSCAVSFAQREPGKGRCLVLLATARIRVADQFGNHHQARTLIDPGAEVLLISETLAHRLWLQRSASSTAIVGVGGQKTGVTRGQVRVTVTSRLDDSTLDVNVFVLPRLTSYGQRFHAMRGTWRFLDALQLADPDPLAWGRIDLLLGADVFQLILREGLLRGEQGEPMAQLTTLSWIVSGSIEHPPLESTVTSHQCSADDEIAARVRQFWEQEEVSRRDPPLSREDKKCMEHYAVTHGRSESGRYVVRLPFKSEPLDLSDTRTAALRLMQATERRFKQDPSLQRLYERFMEEYEQLGHMSVVIPDLRAAGLAECFLPHHGVMREAINGPKLRVVFNGSRKTRAGHSLNDFLSKPSPSALGHIAALALSPIRFLH